MGKKLAPGETLKVTELSRLTPDVEARLFQAINNGAPLVTACSVAGIGRAAFFTWQAQAEQDREAGKTTKFTEFLARLEDAQDKLKDELLAHVKRAAPRDWRAARDLLRMRYPSDFNRARHEHTGRDGGPITGNVLVLTEETKD